MTYLLKKGLTLQQKHEYMKKLILISFALALSFGGANATDRYRNPVIPGFYPDPSICRVDSDYYLVNSSFDYFPGVPLWHSRDLVNWEQIGHCLTRKSQVNLKGTLSWGGIYAPTIRYNDGTFYMITTNTTNGGNFLVYTDNPRGEWSDPVWLEQGGIDPSLFFEDGHCYMVSNPDDGIWLCEINPKTGKTLSPSRRIWNGTGGRYPEGPHIYKKDGYYYLLISEGGTEHAHMITIARSPNIDGPYIGNPSNPILTHCNQLGQSSPIQGTGHADLVDAPDGSWWMVCLAFRPQTNMNHLTGRETYLAPVRWDTNAWPVVNGNGTIALDMTADLPAKPAPQRDFSSDIRFSNKQSLGFEWIYLRNPLMENYQLTSNALRLTGTSATLNSPDLPTFVGRRQQHIGFEATTQLKLTEGNAGDMAGLTVFMDMFSHYDISLRREANGGNTLVVEYWLSSIHHVAKEIALKGGKPYLRVTGTRDHYRFAYSEDGKTFTEVGVADTRYLSSETAGGFTGIILALFCQSGSESSRPKADFYSFMYHPAE